jgi:hypothetical protein
MDPQDERVSEPWNSVKIREISCLCKGILASVEAQCTVGTFQARRYYI